MSQKFRDIGILHGSNQYNILRNIGLCSFQPSSHDQDTLDCSHTKIIMILLGQLLTWQFIKFGHLFAKFFGRSKSLRKKHNFSDESIIRNHHSYWSKQCFKIVGQLCPPRISGIHRNKNTQIMIQNNSLSTKYQISIMFTHQKCLSYC